MSGLRRTAGAGWVPVIRVIAGLLLAGSALLAASPASAHSDLVSANPAQGATLDALPQQIVLTFTTPMKAPATLAVTAPDGSRLRLGEPTIEDRTVSVALPAAPAGQDGQGRQAGQGTYTYAFRAFSADGHQITGQVSFTVGAPGSATPSGSATGTASPTPAAPAASESAGAERPTDSANLSDASEEGSGVGDFWSRHWWQVLVGVLLFGGAAALELAARRSRA